MFTKTTNFIKVTTFPTFLENQSEPDEMHFVWAYTVHIENMGHDTVQLINRTWYITDARGQVQRVHGPGVVGEQPIIRPGDMFEYTSGTVLPTASGIMVGTYEMEDIISRERFDIDIPAFSLDSPMQALRAN